MDANGDVVAEFPGNGVWEFRPVGGWKQINGTDATALAVDASGDVAANFHGFGVGEYRPAAGWRCSSASRPAPWRSTPTAT